jgi:hypothetical protein
VCTDHSCGRASAQGASPGNARPVARSPYSTSSRSLVVGTGDELAAGVSVAMANACKADAEGLREARVTVLARPGGGSVVRIERVPVARLDALAKAARVVHRGTWRSRGP